MNDAQREALTQALTEVFVSQSKMNDVLEEIRKSVMRAEVMKHPVSKLLPFQGEDGLNCKTTNVLLDKI